MKMASAVRARPPANTQRGRNLELDVGGFARNEDGPRLDAPCDPKRRLTPANRHMRQGNVAAHTCRLRATVGIADDQSPNGLRSFYRDIPCRSA